MFENSSGVMQIKETVTYFIEMCADLHVYIYYSDLKC